VGGPGRPAPDATRRGRSVPHVFRPKASLLKEEDDIGARMLHALLEKENFHRQTPTMHRERGAGADPAPAGAEELRGGRQVGRRRCKRRRGFLRRWRGFGPTCPNARPGRDDSVATQCDGRGQVRPRLPVYTDQSSMTRPGTRRKSRAFLVTRVAPSSGAIAAIRTSMLPTLSFMPLIAS
jgi:hypothetical protein